jgi:WD40 repeat protein
MTGGVDRAVAVSADQLYGQLHPYHQEIMRATLLRLVRVLPDGGLARRRAPRGELDERAVSSLVDARLVSVDDEGVRLSHDALLVAWPRLRAWVDAERADLLLRQRLDEAVTNWVDGGRERGDLYRGTRLQAALDWAATRVLAPAERDFLKASERGQRRSTRRLRTVIAALAVLLVASLAASVVAYYQANVSDGRLAEAESRRLATLAQQYLDTWPRESQLLAAASWRRAHTREAREVVLATQNQRLETVLHGHKGVVQSVTFSPDGKSVVSAGQDHTVRVWDVATGQGKVFFTAEDAVNSVVFSPDGKELAVASTDEYLYLLDARTGKVRERIAHKAPVLNAAYSPDGSTIVTTNGTPQLWNTATGKKIGDPFLGHTDIVTSLAFAEGGTTVLGAGPDGMIHVWRVADRAQLRDIKTESVCLFLAYDPNQDVVACRDGTSIGRWNVATGERVGKPLTGHTDTIQQLAFGIGGWLLASASEDRSVRLWYLPTGQQVGEPMRVSDDDTFGITFSPDGRLIAAGSADGDIVLWRAEIPVGPPPTSDAISPDGKRVAFADSDNGEVTVWSVATRKRIHSKDMTCPEATRPAFSPDGEHIAVACADGLTVWNVDGTLVTRISNMKAITVAYAPDGKTLIVGAARGGDAKGGRLMLVRLNGSKHDSQVLWSSDKEDDTPFTVAFSPRGDRVAAGTVGGDVVVVDAANGDEIAKLTGHVDLVLEVAFQPHGNLLASAGADNTVRLWDPDRGAADGAPLVEHTDRATSLSFTPDGTRLVSAGWDGTPIVWDVASHSVFAALRDQGNVQHVQFIDGTDMVGTGSNGTIVSMSIDIDAALADVCERLHPQLTQDQWRQFAPDVEYIPQC